MSRVHSFAPISDARPEVLVLGSMPGKASLRAKQYYAHPRNAFWPIIDEIFGVPRSLPYAQRCTALMRQRIAVWDVLKTCTRTSSLDSDIDQSSVVANDFQTFFAEHPSIRAVYFNGAMAEKMFNRYVLPTLNGLAVDIPKIRLPSTSPANASYSYRQKLAHWWALTG